MNTDYEQHPIAQDIPPMTAEEFEGLRKSIREHGYDRDKPIILFQHMVLEGMSRYRACMAENVTPVFKEFAGDDPVAFVIRENLDRRHLTPAQKLHIAEKMRPKLEEEAHARMKGGQGPSDPPAFLQEGQTVNAKLASMAGVSERTVANYRAIQLNGSQEVKEAVHEGKVSITDAATL